MCCFIGFVEFILIFYFFGIDVFQEMHPPSAYEILADFYIGDCEARKINSTNKNGTAFAEEIRQFRDQLEKDGMFEASTVFYVYKVISTLAICGAGLAILKYFGKTSSAAVWISAFIVGFFWQQCGWLAHDFAHYQVIKDPKVNNFFLVTLGNLVQGFSLSW
jgi:fatty acid desaturase